MQLDEVESLTNQEAILHCIQQLDLINIKTVEDFLSTHYLYIYQQHNELNLESLKTIHQYLITNNLNKIYNGSLKLEQQSKLNFISTGYLNLDKILDGGLFSNRLYEFIGLPSTGKTHLCVNMTLNYLLNHSEQSVLWLQIGKNFPTKLILKELNARLKNKNQHSEFDEELNHILNRFKLIELSSFDDLITNLKQIYENSRGEFGLIILDNPSLNISVTLNAPLGIGQRTLVNTMNQLRLLANQFPCPVIINSLGRYPADKDSIQKYGAIQPKFGNTWSYLSDVQLILYRINQSSKNHFDINDFNDSLIVTDEDLSQLGHEDLNPWLKCYIYKNRFGASNIYCEICLHSK